MCTDVDLNCIRRIFTSLANPETQQKLRQYFRQMRCESNLSFEQLSLLTEIDPDYLQDMEKGREPFNFLTLAILLEIFPTPGTPLNKPDPKWIDLMIDLKLPIEHDEAGENYFVTPQNALRRKLIQKRRQYNLSIAEAAKNSDCPEALLEIWEKGLVDLREGALTRLIKLYEKPDGTNE